MVSQFHFKNFEADESIRTRANLSLSRILDRGPCDSRAVALLEAQEQGFFRCSVDIYSRQGPFMASTVRTSVEEAIQAAEDKIKGQLEWWWAHRGRDPNAEEKEILQTAS